MSTTLTSDLFRRFRDLLLTRSGLYFPDHRQNDLHHCLISVLPATGCASLEAMYTAAVASERVLHTIIESVTVGETYFFRNASQFAALRDRIIPDLIARREAIRSLRFWSAGCSTGEEPYSLAILLRDTLPDFDNWQITILATDINAGFLERARAGVYGAWSFRETDPTVRDRYFERIEGTRWRIRSDIRRQVLFTRLNLVEDEYPAVMNGTSMQDVILCRNVLIYFDDETIRAVVRRLYRALTPGGWLIVGHAEARSDFFARFEVINCPGTVIYRKPLNAPLFDETAVPPLSPARTTPVSLPNVSSSDVSSGLPALPVALSHSEPAPVRATDTDAQAFDDLQAARQSADRGDLEEALRLCATIIQREPLCAEAHLLTGQILEQQERFDEALAAYRRAIYLDHTLYLASLAMAGILQRTGHTDDARRAYRRLLRSLAALQPDAPVPSLNGATAAELQMFIRNRMAALGS
jgi:chemotaxis protein methyltransferase CheR